MAIWATVSPEVDIERGAQRALARGVAFHTGRRYAFDGRPCPYVRLSFASLDEAQLQAAVRRMASTLSAA